MSGDGWTQHTFDTDGGGRPDLHRRHTLLSLYASGGPEKLLILLQGGGACWEGLARCNVFAEAQAPPAPRVGIWDFDSPDNPLAEYSIVYMPYCDGSAFGGDNEVTTEPTFGTGVRRHRGLRNLSAGMDVARSVFKRPEKIVVAGSSAGGVGAAAFAPFLARFTYGNTKELFVFNDAGPTVVNLGAADAVVARDLDWGFAQFYPESCTECSAFGQQTAIIDGGCKMTRRSVNPSMKRTATGRTLASPAPICPSRHRLNCRHLFPSTSISGTPTARCHKANTARSFSRGSALTHLEYPSASTTRTTHSTPLIRIATSVS